MSLEQDKFYQQLPFTLPPEQSKPSFLILGTGLQQCLLAAHFSKIHLKQGLIIDIDRTYGSCLKTVTLKQLHSLAIGEQKQKLYTFIKLEKYCEKNNEYYQQCINNKAFRGYNIDIEPNFFFGDSHACQLLKQAEMDKYMDFRLVGRMLHYDNSKKNNKLGHVPLSKGKIFQSKDLSLLQKKILLSAFHSLAQIYHKYKNIEQNQNSTKQFDKGFGQVDSQLYQQFLKNKKQYFMEFLSKKITKNNKKIMDYMIYIICNYQYNCNKFEQLPDFIKEEYTLQKFILKFGKFLKSCGIYGEGPYLYVDNGIGDVPQSYSRIASIFGSTYILHPKITIDKIQQDSQNQKVKVYTNLYKQGYIQTDKLYIGPTFYQYYQQQQSSQQKQPHHIVTYNTQKILRVILLSSKKNTTENQQQQQEQKQFPALAYLLNLQEQLFPHPVYLFMFDSTSHSCPKGLNIYQFETVLQAKSSKEEGLQKQNDKVIENKVEKLIEIIKQMQNDTNFNDRIKYVTACIRQKRYPIDFSIQQKNMQQLLKDHNGIDLDSHFVNFKEVIGQQTSYFKKQKQADANGNNENEEQGQDYETMDLVDRLDNISWENKKEIIKNQDNEQQQNKQQQNIQIKQINPKPIQSEQKQKQQELAQQKQQSQVKNVQSHQNLQLQQIKNQLETQNNNDNAKQTECQNDD